MSKQLDTETRDTTGVEDAWPPLAHLCREKPAKEGSLALCGAKLMGINLEDAHKVCKKCIEIAKRVGS
jgi:hypothetical protein